MRGALSNLDGAGSVGTRGALDVLAGGGDWDEGMYWIGAIDDFCRSKSTRCLMVPAPFESQVVVRGNQGHFPGKLSDLRPDSPMFLLNPVEAFVDEHLRLVDEATALGRRPATSPLFNGHLSDGHFSARGAALWAREVGRRVVRLFKPSMRPGDDGER